LRPDHDISRTRPSWRRNIIENHHTGRMGHRC
jgi:hypothetical protein